MSKSGGAKLADRKACSPSKTTFIRWPAAVKIRTNSRRCERASSATMILSGKVTFASNADVLFTSVSQAETYAAIAGPLTLIPFNLIIATTIESLDGRKAAK